MQTISDNPITPLDKTEPADLPASARRRDWQVAALVAGGVVFTVGNLLHPLMMTTPAAGPVAPIIATMARVPTMIDGPAQRGRRRARWAAQPSAREPPPLRLVDDSGFAPATRVVG